MISRNLNIFILFFTFICLFTVCKDKKPSKMLIQKRLYWQEATSAAEFSGRFGHQLVVFDNKIWLIGGHDSTGLKNDIWYSSDGLHWIESISSNCFSPRRYHGAVVYKKKIWVIGGFTTKGRASDVWSSTDGINWTQITTSAVFPERQMHQIIVFDNKMWVIGGSMGSGVRLNDVFYSIDGVHWTEATSNANFSKRWGHKVLVFADKMWLIGGSEGNGMKDNKNDVWYSQDGINWIEATTNAEFAGRHLPGAIIYNEKFWLTAGVTDWINESPQVKNDLWYSDTGIEWTEIITAKCYPSRSNSTSILFDNKLWLIGGTADNFYNDVWYFDLSNLY